jgi:hypothetical protein
MLKFSRKILWLNLIPVKQFHQAKEGLPKKKLRIRGIQTLVLFLVLQKPLRFAIKNNFWSQAGWWYTYPSEKY